jgi:hypothetical protein
MVESRDHAASDYYSCQATVTCRTGPQMITRGDIQCHHAAVTPAGFLHMHW